MVVSGVLVPAGTTVWPIMAEVLKGDHWGDGEVFRLVLQTIDRFHNRFSPCTEKASPWLKGSTTAFSKIFKWPCSKLHIICYDAGKL